MSSLRFEMDGEWDLDDLAKLSTSLKLTYAYFYWISVPPDHVPSHVKNQITRYFWSGDYVGEKFNEMLYESIPRQDRLRLQSIEYHSPGWIIVAGTLGALEFAGRVVKVWAESMGNVLDLLTKIEKFFEERKLRKIGNRVSLDYIEGVTLDEARMLCFALGALIGFSDDKVEHLIGLAGNPISVLRLFMALTREARRTADLQKLPRASS